MPPRIQMREVEVDRMIQLLRQAAMQFRDVENQMHGIARQIDDGALLGEGGQNFSEALNQTLANAIEKLAEKLEERARFIEREKQQLKQAMESSGGQYS